MTTTCIFSRGITTATRLRAPTGWVLAKKSFPIGGHGAFTPRPCFDFLIRGGVELRPPSSLGGHSSAWNISATTARCWLFGGESALFWSRFHSGGICLDQLE